MAFIGLAGTAFVLPTQTPHGIVTRSAPSMGIFDDLAKGMGDFFAGAIKISDQLTKAQVNSFYYQAFFANCSNY